MSTFIETSNCRGQRPEGVVARRYVSRPDLIARLLRDRHVARFVVAPEGFGKGSLAFEYADIVFSFQHVFWVDAHSPCFLRDLDARTLSEGIRKADAEVRLVVWRNVPHLDPDRAAAFNELVEELLACDIEVVVTCVPSADSFSRLQHDRVLLSGDDLLLSDAEMAAEEAGGRLASGWALDVPRAERVACLRWGEVGPGALVAGLRKEELPAETRLAILGLFVLERGTLDELSSFVAAERIEEMVPFLERGYAFLGIDRRTRAFRAAHVELDELARILYPRIEEMVEPSTQPDRDALCSRFADVLLARGEGARAAAFLRVFATKSASAAWLGARGWHLLACGDPLPISELHHASYRGAQGMHDALGVLNAWAISVMGDVFQAQTQARRVARSASARPLDRLRACVLLASAGGGEGRTMALGMMGELAASVRAGERRAAEDAAAADALDWPSLAELCLALAQGAQDGIACWFELKARAEEDEAPEVTASALLGAAWLLDEVAGQVEGDASFALRAFDELAQPSFAAVVGEVFAYVCARVEEESAWGRVSWCALCAGSALERFAASWPYGAEATLSANAASMLHKAEVALFEQGDAYRRSNALRDRRKRAFQLTHPDAFRRETTPAAQAAGAAQTAVPTLHVSLFGGLDIRVGADHVDLRTLSRQKSRALLAVLLLSHGRELSRERLAALMWPDSKPDTARKNFYSIWSQLKRALSVNGERECPYLISTQDGCRIDTRFVASDAFTFEALCRSLLFGTPDAERWEHIYAQVCDEYADDLLPNERDNELVCSLRERYRTQLIDALVAASARLARQGEPRGSLWFAREALRRDSSREDVYVALMEAQIASDQRGPALDTYFACRKFLSEELGIDPSLRVVELYRSIIETEQRLE